ncbi:MAG: hypothetical protein JW720_07075 [Sedimentisphaerales bacterium]|nr:hypothetical protein [Sedimentisphaerales bacterium]
MDWDELTREHLAKRNWRAHIANYAQTKGQRTPEEYCQQQNIDVEGFNIWLNYIEEEDKYAFFRSFATEYLRRAEKSLKLVEKYMNEPELRMPLMRDAIVAYGALFKNSAGRVRGSKLTLKEIEQSIPKSLQAVHRTICGERDQIVVHCDLTPRNPRVGMRATTIKGKGHYWEDYKVLIPDFRRVIVVVQKRLEEYISANLSRARFFGSFVDGPECAKQDPGSPS